MSQSGVRGSQSARPRQSAERADRQVRRDHGERPLPLSGLDRRAGGLKWLGEPVSVWKGAVFGVAVTMPTFDCRPFAIDQSGGPRQAALFPTLSPQNKYYDVIVRRPDATLGVEVPVGIVSKRYTLVQHRELFSTALSALASIGVRACEVKAELLLTEYGSRMALRLRLPLRYDLDPGDGCRMALRLECLNSVDRSIPLRMMHRERVFNRC